MKNYFKQIKDSLSSKKESDGNETESDYLELDTDTAFDKSSQKITVRTFVLEDFADVKAILDSLREGYTIALVNIKPLKDKDMVELKRSINKLKKTTDAMEGEIAGFGEDYIIIAPSFAQIYKTPQIKPAAADKEE
jgi:SepF-like predicted cell division protein (DUF552 family)